VGGRGGCSYSGGVTRVFVSPHPDDVALSCGGLIVALRARGERIAILTVFSGSGDDQRQLTPYQRLALGFGSHEKARAGDDAASLDLFATSGSEADADEDDPPTPAKVMAVRRAEDEAYARFVGASISFFDLPDAVFRGYRGDAELTGPPRPNDPAPVAELRGALARLQPETLYLPFSVGGHVDHRQARRAAIALLSEPASPYLYRTVFYEDFPYALNVGFEGIGDLDPEVMPSLPAGTALVPEYVPLADEIDRKLDGLRAYESQLGRLFGGDHTMADDVRRQAARVGRFGGTGPAERYWRVIT
jgi:LmbE family N-acetylglucosaminyl deacetylase